VGKRIRGLAVHLAVADQEAEQILAPQLKAQLAKLEQLAHVGPAASDAWKKMGH